MPRNNQDFELGTGLSRRPFTLPLTKEEENQYEDEMAKAEMEEGK